MLSPVELVFSLDTDRRNLLTQVEKLKAERNVVSKEISQSKDAAERQAKIDAMRAGGRPHRELDETVREVETNLQNLLYSIPNLPDPSTPYGKDESENVVVRSEGQLPEFDFTPLPHWELGDHTGNH